MRQTMIMSNLTRLSARIIRAPIPVGMATISAAITVRQAIPASSLRPVKIFGSESGRIILNRILLLEAPRERAAFI